jgi:hypothetical protein
MNATAPAAMYAPKWPQAKHLRDVDDGFRVAAEAFNAAVDAGAPESLQETLFAIMMREYRGACAIDLMFESAGSA